MRHLELCLTACTALIASSAAPAPLKTGSGGIPTASPDEHRVTFTAPSSETFATGAFVISRESCNGPLTLRQFNEATFTDMLKMEIGAEYAKTMENEKIFVLGNHPDSKKVKYSILYEIRCTGRCIATELNHEFTPGCAIFHFRSTLYVGGGLVSEKAISTVQKYDLCTKKWSAGPELKRPRAHFTFWGSSHEVFAIGGTDGSNHVAEMENIDFDKTGKWEVYGKPMTTKAMRSRFALCLRNGRAFMAGGRSADKKLTNLTQSWCCIRGYIFCDVVRSRL